MVAYPGYAWLSMRVLFLVALWELLICSVRGGDIRRSREGNDLFLCFLRNVCIFYGMQPFFFYNCLELGIRCIFKVNYTCLRNIVGAMIVQREVGFWNLGNLFGRFSNTWKAMTIMEPKGGWREGLWHSTRHAKMKADIGGAKRVINPLFIILSTSACPASYSAHLNVPTGPRRQKSEKAIVEETAGKDGMFRELASPFIIFSTSVHPWTSNLHKATSYQTKGAAIRRAMINGGQPKVSTLFIVLSTSANPLNSGFCKPYNGKPVLRVNGEFIGAFQGPPPLVISTSFIGPWEKEHG